MTDYETRFGALGRLYGREGLARLRAARVAVIGLGGVGSWVVEALARSGLGGLTLVDMDEVCLSNVNRQLHALDGAIGRSKAEALAERVGRIAPECAVRAEVCYFTESTAERLLAPGFDYVVDAIDTTRHKCLLMVGGAPSAAPADHLRRRGRTDRSLAGADGRPRTHDQRSAAFAGAQAAAPGPRLSPG